MPPLHHDPPTPVAIAHLIVDHINALAADIPLADWIEAVRTLVAAQFAEVDRISISLNANCPLEKPDGYDPRLHVAEYPVQVNPSDQAVFVASRDDSAGANLLDGFRRMGVPLDLYHDPVIIEYKYRGLAYLGTMFLWREKERESISQKTLETFGYLAPFLMLAFTNAVLFERLRNPAEIIAHRALEEISSKFGLTRQQQRVITYRIFGLSHKVIAGKMGVREDSVRRYAKAAYTKCHVSGHTDFVAFLITPRLFPSADA